MTMQLIETVTVGAGGASGISLVDIPQDGDDLLLVVSARTGYSGYANVFDTLTVNSGAYFNEEYTRATGTSVSDSTGAQLTNVSVGSFATSNTFSNNAFYFADYTSSNRKVVNVKSTTTENGSSGMVRQFSFGGTSSPHSPITSIELNTSYTYQQHTTVSLYKITHA